MKITKEDACRILGVTEESTSDEVRSSYKRLALKWHPDKHGDSHVSKDEATHKFQEVWSTSYTFMIYFFILLNPGSMCCLDQMGRH